MAENRRVRLIRKHKPAVDEAQAAAAVPSAPSEREIKTVVSRWVSEHRRRSEEFRRTFSAMFRTGEFNLPTN